MVRMFSKIILLYVALFVTTSQSSSVPMLGWILSDAFWGIVENGPGFSLELQNFLYQKPFDNSPQLSGLPISIHEEYVNYEYEEYEDEEYLQ